MKLHGDAVRWAAVRRLYEETVDLPADERAAVLDRARGDAGDDARPADEDAAARDDVVARVEALLAASAVEDAALDGTAVALLEPGAADTAHGAAATSPSEVDRAGASAATDDATPDDDLLGATVGGHVLRERLGSGGQADVWLAERTVGSATRRAAVKVLRRGLDTDALLRRFRREQETLASLHHEHVVAFLDAGRLPDGRPWFLMEAVDGAPITEACRALDLRARVALVATVCDAVQFAHGRLVLHRDLKPTNILVTAGGAPKLLDFGVSALLRPDGDLARTDATRSPAPLTPRYAAPEQLRDERASVATDVFALGLVLWETLVGRPAREARSMADVVARIDDPLPPPSTAMDDPRAARGDLDAVVLRATHPEPARRYPSAEALAADLRRWLDGEPVVARRGTRLDALRRLLRAHRAVVLATGVVVLLLAAGLVGTWLGRERAVRDASRGWGAHAAARSAVRFLEELLAAEAVADGGATDGRDTSTPPDSGRAAATRPPWDDPAVDARIDATLADLPESEALVHTALGRLALDAGRADAALPHLERAAELAGQPIAMGLREAARIRLLLGLARAELGHATAADTLREAAAALEALDPPDVDGAARARAVLADLER